MSRSIARLLAASSLVLPLALGACGKQGSLDRPAPLFGAQAKAQYQAQQDAKAAARTKADSKSHTETDEETASDRSSPSTLSDRPDPALDPLRANPIPGTPPDPFAPQQGGVLPDPYANPNKTPL